jgi:hypothetical protein
VGLARREGTLAAFPETEEEVSIFHHPGSTFTCPAIEQAHEGPGHVDSVGSWGT